MYTTYFHTLPVLETLSLNTLPLTLLILGFIDFLLVHVSSKRQQSHDQSKVDAARSKNIEAVEDSSDQESFMPEKPSDESLCRGEMELVMRSLGISCNHDDDNLPTRLDPNEILRLFEEKNPGLDEVREAFDVFDGNKDGFIDARELQIVLCALGFSEGSEMENCRQMIRAFDDNGDGRIDFHEFEKFMQNSAFADC